MKRRRQQASFLVCVIVLALASRSTPILANTPSQFRLAPRGVSLLQTEGTAAGTGTGFARIRLETGSPYPAGVAIFGLRQNGVLITEAAVSAAVPSTSGRIYAEIGGGVDTGLAIANPNNAAAEVSFYFTSADGSSIGDGRIDIPANGKIARFLSEDPFNGAVGLRGTFTYTSTIPVAVTALRGLNNTRGEFLITTLPVAPTSSTQTGTSYIPHFADGGGWTTQVILVNPTDGLLTGTIRFVGNGTPGAIAPIISDTPYSIAPRSSFRVVTSGTAAEPGTGSVRVFSSAAGQALPATMTIFSFTRNGNTVSEAGVAGVTGGLGYRVYTEVSGNFDAGEVGAIQTGFAITNVNPTQDVTVTLELMTLASTIIRTASLIVPARGQRAMFLSQVPEFNDLPLPFYGVLRLRSAGNTSIGVTGLRGRYNERGDFLFASTPPVLEGTSSASEIIFPHIADGGGYTTQFVLMSNAGGEAAAGSLAFYESAGASLSLPLRSIVPPKPSVTVFSAGALITEPGNLFDLEGKTLRFSPSGSTYSVQSLPLAFDDSTGVILSNSSATRGGQFPQVLSWSVPLGFPLPFAGRTWNGVFVNSYGSISFGSAESGVSSGRDPWPNATMKSNAAAMDSLSAAGMETMIAVFWSMYDSGLGSTRVANNSDDVTITWESQRNDRYVSPLGLNVFQAKLRRTGVIDLSYKQVSERDGITGFFTDQLSTPVALDHIDRTSAADPMVRVNSVDVADMGKTVRFTLVIGSDIATTVPSGEMDYRISLRISGRSCIYELQVSAAGRQTNSTCNGAQPQEFGYSVSGNTLQILMSKVVLSGATMFSWAFDVVYFGPTTIFENSLGAYRSITLPAPVKLDLSSTSVLSGPTTEVFHYPVMSRDPAESLRQVYQTSPPVDDLALVFTDFRYDEIFGGEGPSYSPPGNDRIQGIATTRGTIASAATYGSRQLLVTPSPAYIGHPPFSERLLYDGKQFINYGFGVAWAAHELTHHWVTRIRFRNPVNGQTESLTDGAGHWTPWLHVTSYRDVSVEFATSRYTQSSVMGGDSSWSDNSDGTYTQTGLYFRNLSGLSALDLYLMGLLAPEEVPDTFLLKDPTAVSTRRYRATKVPVRIQDIVAVEGPRIPAASDSQKIFRLGVYLLHDPARTPNAAMLSRTEAFARALIHYFDVASGGRMKVIQ